MALLYPKILDRTLDKAYSRARGFCTSRQLRRSMRKRVHIRTASRAKGDLYVPQYWAYYKHEGRGPVSVKSGGAAYLVWFKNPWEDPRLKGGDSPIRRSQIKQLRLSRSEFNRLRKAGKLFVKKQVGPMAAVKKNPFFGSGPSGGLYALDGQFKTIAKQEAYSHVEQWLKRTGLKKKTVKISL